MPTDRFRVCLDRVLVDEGGYADHPKDPGGRTMQGVTQATYDDWRRKQGLPTRWVKMIERAELEAIYRAGYWDRVRGDELPAGLDYAAFDAAVNSGPARGARWLQQAVGAKPDGVVGPATVAAARRVDAAEAVADMCAVRLRFLRGLSTWRTFGKGWARRVSRVERLAVADTKTAPAPAPKPDMAAPAPSGGWLAALLAILARIIRRLKCGNG